MSDDNYGGQRSGDNYVDKNGVQHMHRSDAEAVNNASASDGGIADAGAKAMGSAIGPLIGLAAVFFIIQVAIKQYALYVLPAGGLVLLVCISPAFFSIKKGGFVFLGLLAAMVGCILFGKFIYYPNVVEPSPFTADYLINEAAIHSQRNGKGKELALLPEGERVTVNGVSRDRKEFNITANDGSKGWIPAAAFPKDANVLPDDIGGLMKHWLPFFGTLYQSEFARDYLRRGDRDWFNRIEAVASYFEVDPNAAERGEGVLSPPDTQNGELYDDTWPYLGNDNGLKPSALDRAVRVNQPFPVTINASSGRGKSKETFSGVVEMTLWYVLYTPEATIVSINRGDHEWAGVFTDTYDNEDFYKSLVLKDLDTGVTFPFVANMDYSDFSATANESIFIFPPVTTRHFALVHEKPSKKGEDTAAWDIPEVRIATNAPTMANDPFVVMQKRIADFKGNGSNAITTAENTLYVAPGSAEKLAVLPAGEVVTILEEETRDGSWKVRYKDLEGYLDKWNMKK